jgi:LPS export ABC transporter protein LptC
MLILGVALLAACQKTEVIAPQIYDGPIREAENIEMVQTDKEKITVRVRAKRIHEFQNGDRQFPEGIYIEFYDEVGGIASTLSANSAFFYKIDNKWLGQGKVEVKNIQKREQLNTEELLWFPITKKITTDKFVTVRTGNEVLYGTGLQANQDMSDYVISKVEGEFAIEDE